MFKSFRTKRMIRAAAALTLVVVIICGMLIGNADMKVYAYPTSDTFPKIGGCAYMGYLGTHLDPNLNVVIDDPNMFDTMARYKMIIFTRPDYNFVTTPGIKEIAALRKRAHELGNDIKLIAMCSSVYFAVVEDAYAAAKPDYGGTVTETKTWADNHEAWFLHKTGYGTYRDRLGQDGGYTGDHCQGYYLVNPKDPNCRNFLINKATEIMSKQVDGVPVYDGIQIDQIGFGAQPNEYAGDPDWFNTWRSDWVPIISAIRSNWPNALIVPNTGLGNNNSPWWPYLNGTQEEDFFTCLPSDRSNDLWRMSYYFNFYKDYQKVYMDSSLRSAYGLIDWEVMDRGPALDGSVPPWTTAEIMSDAFKMKLIRYGVSASCILGSYFSFSDVHGIPGYWFPEYNAHLGNPTGGYTIPAGHTEFYVRDFTGGLALLNNEAGSASYTLPGGCDYKMNSSPFTTYTGGQSITVPSLDGFTLTKIPYSLVNLTSGYGWYYAPPVDDPSEYGQDIVWIDNNTSQFTYTFKGTGIELFSTKAPTQGNISISIDGGTPVTVSENAPTTQYQKSIWSKKDLTYKTHTITINKLTGTYASIDFFKVYNEFTGFNYPDVNYKAGDGNIGWAATADPLIDYGSCIWTNDTTAPVTYTFNGTAVDVIGQKDSNYGNMQVTVDGTSYIVNCYSATPVYNSVLKSITGLAAGTHYISIRAATGGGSGYICISGVRVY